MRPPVRLLPLLALALSLAASLPVRAEQAPQAPLPQQGTVLLGGRVRVRVEVAVTEEEKARGLSGRAGLPPGTGMLFPYPAPGFRSMWMREMRFPLDFLWIRDGRVVDLFEEVPPPAPGETPRTVASPEPAQAILEVPAGFIRTHRLRRGDAAEVRLDRKSP
ncbi:MAG: DUF192 domain-containing protein [candidate division NC10 bacterium]|nr:DUF192 domain-containing protein [candidate division NC10 bacterium]